MMDTDLYHNVIKGKPSKEAHLLARVGSYEIYVHREEGTITVYTTEHHPGTLIITKDGLEKLLADLK